MKQLRTQRVNSSKSHGDFRRHRPEPYPVNWMADVHAHMQRASAYAATLDCAAGHKDLTAFEEVRNATETYLRSIAQEAAMTVPRFLEALQKGPNADVAPIETAAKRWKARAEALCAPSLDDKFNDFLEETTKLLDVPRAACKVLETCGKLIKHFAGHEGMFTETTFRLVVFDAARAGDAHYDFQKGVVQVELCDAEVASAEAFRTYSERYNIKTQGAAVFENESKKFCDTVRGVFESTEYSSEDRTRIGNAITEDMCLFLQRLAVYSLTPDRDREALGVCPAIVSLCLSSEGVTACGVAAEKTTYNENEIKALRQAQLGIEALSGVTEQTLRTHLEWILRPNIGDDALGNVVKVLAALQAKAIPCIQAYSDVVVAGLRKHSKKLAPCLVHGDKPDTEFMDKYKVDDTRRPYINLRNEVDSATARLQRVGEGLLGINNTVMNAKNQLKSAEYLVNRYAMLLILQRKHVQHETKGKNLRAELKDMYDTVINEGLREHFKHSECLSRTEELLGINAH